MLTKFVEWGWISNLFDIYNLEIHFAELIHKEGFGVRSVQKLRKAIENSKNVELNHFITALSIPGIGPAQAKVLAKKFKTWDNFYNAGLSNYRFEAINGFGSVLNQNIHQWFSTGYQEGRISQLVRNVNFIGENLHESNNLDGLIFVITGTLNSFSNRDALKNRLESEGGKVSGSISSKTSFLINNDVNSQSSKNKKAKSLGVKIISEEELLNMYPFLKG